MIPTTMSCTDISPLIKSSNYNSLETHLYRYDFRFYTTIQLISLALVFNDYILLHYNSFCWLCSCEFFLLINCKTGLKLSENLASFAPQLEHLHWQDLRYCSMYHNESRVIAKQAWSIIMFKPYSTDCEYSDSIMIKESMSQSWRFQPYCSTNYTNKYCSQNPSIVF